MDDLLPRTLGNLKLVERRMTKFLSDGNASKDNVVEDVVLLLRTLLARFPAASTALDSGTTTSGTVVDTTSKPKIIS